MSTIEAELSQRDFISFAKKPRSRGGQPLKRPTAGISPTLPEPLYYPLYVLSEREYKDIPEVGFPAK